MIVRLSSSARTNVLLGGLSLLTLAGAFAQAPQTEVAAPAVPLAQPVPLIAGACPAVRQDGVISLDWNPGFDPAGAATGMKAFRLVFLRVGEDGVNLSNTTRFLFDSGPRGKVTAIGNGYFHIEARLASAMRPGVYRLVEAHAGPEISQDYQGEAPKMTVSPAREFYCITVVPRPAPPPAPLP